MHLLFLAVLLVLLHHATGYAATAASGGCQRRCGGTAPVPYPFGFSPGCPIPLSCDANTSTPILPHKSGVDNGSSYRVLAFNSTASAVLVAFPPSCSRSVPDARGALSGSNYGVSFRTGLFLRGCETNTSVCSVPAGVMSNLLRTAQCGENGTTSAAAPVACVSSPVTNATTAAAHQFLRWEKAEQSKCKYVLTSAVYMEAPDGTMSLEFSVLELGWWLNGTCAGGHEPCAANATCSDVQTPSRSVGHRCACVAGMDGDGVSAGDGCYLKAKPVSKKNVAFIVGGVVVGVAAAAGVLLLLCLVRRRRSSGGKGRSGQSRLAAMRLLSEAASSSGVPVYSYNEVARATNSFSHTHRLGTGAYGTVYVGRLPPSSTAPLVAIKRLRCRHDDDDGRTVALLLNEIRLISSLSHPNLVRLLGCCLDRGEHILVYELVPNGTLAHHLHGGGEGGGATLPWRVRLGVAAGTAAAVAYLHAFRPSSTATSSPATSSSAPTSAPSSPISASPAAASAPRTPRARTSPRRRRARPGGYVDPDYHQSFHLSDKSDVYSFGVVLLELITAMRVVDFGRQPSEVNLASLALDRIGKGRVEEIVDPALLRHGEEWIMESVRHVSELAFRCLAFDKDVRPCMSEVAEELCRIRDAAPDSGMTDPVTANDSVQNTAAKNKARSSPVSVQEVWTSDQSSPSTNGSMPRFA